MPTNQISSTARIAIAGIGRHGADPGLPAAAHQAERQAVLQENKIGGPMPNITSGWRYSR